MIHPQTEIRFINDTIGSGVFATANLLCGTIIVAKDPFDSIITRDIFNALPEILRDHLETYLYHDKQGRLFLSWDHAKYMNHRCNSNTMMTDYDIEIAIRDISAGEEITTEYGLLNIQDPYPIACGCPDCREHLRHDDIDRYAEKWDTLILHAIQQIPRVPQPLWEILTPETQNRLSHTANTPNQYSSIQQLKWRQTQQ